MKKVMVKTAQNVIIIMIGTDGAIIVNNDVHYTIHFKNRRCADLLDSELKDDYNQQIYKKYGSMEFVGLIRLVIHDLDQYAEYMVV